MQLTGEWERPCTETLPNFGFCQHTFYRINRLSLDLGQFVISGGVQHQEGGGGGGRQLCPGLVQLHPRQDADRVEPSNEDQEPDEPGEHPGPGLEGGLQRLPRPVPGQPQRQLQAALLQASKLDIFWIFRTLTLSLSF